MGLFDERIAYKPFEYPVYYTEGWLKQAQAFWLHTEISMQSDIKDWNEKPTPKEKNLVGYYANQNNSRNSGLNQVNKFFLQFGQLLPNKAVKLGNTLG